MAKKRTKQPNFRELMLMGTLLSGERYGLEIRDQYEKDTKQPLPLGSLYVVLGQLEDAGFIESRIGEANSETGGNRRKYFRLTAPGHRALSMLAAIGKAAAHAS